MDEKTSNLIILFSGGLESRYLVSMALNMGFRPLCVLVDYGQKHVAELEKAVAVCNKLGLPFAEAKVQIPMIRSALAGEDTQQYAGVSRWYVPARNLMLIAIASSIAESQNIDTIWFGASYTDRVNRFPDCTQEWVIKLNEALVQGLSKVIKVEAPLLGFSKDLVRIIAGVCGIKDEEVFSGYGGQHE